ncbi:FMN-binding protein [Actinomadura verrucosospora]|uniref:FMN-binding domain-containing protein n=1 Tax=Actinomadura verrucosospora TaxID=46165 RepID=A0A7D3ZFS2_ACTVE|nr:FMN-binding protein [Actinomadura verrucosospora]QKG22317.1 FMN-binding domain-containing protein [Actinomadura verrucosospora]
MRRALIATGTTAAGVVLLLGLKPHHSDVTGVSSSAPQSSAPGTVGGSSAGSSGASSGTSGSSGGSSAKTSGTFKGDVIDTKYGPVQVEITATGGKLTAVRVLQTPSENGRDREIADFSVPQLTKEALAAGNAHIDSVSGATYTSEGYIRSLQSALDAARA